MATKVRKESLEKTKRACGEGAENLKSLKADVNRSCGEGLEKTKESLEKARKVCLTKISDAKKVSSSVLERNCTPDCNETMQNGLEKCLQVADKVEAKKKEGLEVAGKLCLHTKETVERNCGATIETTQRVLTEGSESLGRNCGDGLETTVGICVAGASVFGEKTTDAKNFCGESMKSGYKKGCRIAGETRTCVEKGSKKLQRTCAELPEKLPELPSLPEVMADMPAHTSELLQNQKANLRVCTGDMKVQLEHLGQQGSEKVKALNQIVKKTSKRSLSTCTENLEEMPKKLKRCTENCSERLEDVPMKVLNFGKDTKRACSEMFGKVGKAASRVGKSASANFAGPSAKSGFSFSTGFTTAKKRTNPQDGEDPGAEGVESDEGEGKYLV